MRILCVADHIDPVVYSTRIKDRFKDVDMVFGAGDLPMEYLGFIASTLNKPVLFVFGNHNLKRMDVYKKPSLANIYANPQDEYSSHRFGSIHIDRTVHRQGGLLVAGLGGSIQYNKGDNQFTQGQMWLRVLGLVPRLVFNRIMYGRSLDILLAHSAPFGLNDRDDPCHRGFKSFLWLMKVFKPKFLLHGHIHLYDQNDPRETRFCETRIINVYDHYVLQFDV